MRLLLNVLVFNVWLKEEEKEKNEGGKESTSPLNPSKVTPVKAGRWKDHATMGRGATTMIACLFV